MHTNIEERLDAVLENATTMSKHLNSFNQYSPAAPEESPDRLEALIARLQMVYHNEMDRLKAFALDVEVRQMVYNHGANSLRKLISPLDVTLKELYGANSKVANHCETIMTSFEETQDFKPYIVPNEAIVAESKQSFGNVAQAFSDLIEGLFTIQPIYRPSNEDIALSQLTTKLAQLNAANSNVCIAYSALQKYRHIRDELYLELCGCVNHIKESVKRQFGNESFEYQTLKSLEV